VAPSGHPTVLAAGGVLWRPAGSGFEIAVVHRPRYDDWSLPKGKLDRGEDPLLGALREVREETGFRSVAGQHLGLSSYAIALDGRLTPKTVEWWAMRVADGHFVASDEVDDLRWCTPATASDLLTAGRDVDQVDLLSSTGAGLQTGVLVRHGAAGSRQDWPGPDDQRPLSSKGQRQAELLVDQLRAYGVTRVLAAPPVRCQETVRPLAAALGVPVEVEPLFGEDGFDPTATTARWNALVQGGGVPVVSSQGGVLPALLEIVTEASGLRLGDTRTRKAAAWVLSMRGTAVVSAEHRSPPA
jgi:8-oxo-dGTP pyrophosphatase MutT (NUDIX family)/phosphohistidine phosphatase SixA